MYYAFLLKNGAVSLCALVPTMSYSYQKTKRATAGSNGYCAYGERVVFACVLRSRSVEDGGGDCRQRHAEGRETKKDGMRGIEKKTFL